jgi:hypothetical protein
VLRLALAEAQRRSPGRALGTAQTSTSMRIVGSALHIDVDVSAPFSELVAEAAR